VVEQLPGRVPRSRVACPAATSESRSASCLTGDEVSARALAVRVVAGDVGGTDEPGRAKTGMSPAWYREDNEPSGVRGERRVGGSAHLGTPSDMASLDYGWEGPEVLVLTIRGEVDMSNVEILREGLEKILQPQTRSVVFDLSALEFIDSSGLAVLIDVAQNVGDAHVRDPSRLVRRVIEVTGLAELLPIEQ
jgi:anti-sigma B factor antagonist